MIGDYTENKLPRPINNSRKTIICLINTHIIYIYYASIVAGCFINLKWRELAMRCGCLLQSITY